MAETDSELTSLVAACAAHPTSAVLLTTMLAEATRTGEIEAATDYLTTLSPATITDPVLRRKIAAFLEEAEADASPWSSAPVIQLAAHRHAPEAAAPAAQITFADVGGLDDVKRQIVRRVIAPRQNPGLFDRFKRRAGGGILLYGPPGCGKTMLARATAAESHSTFIEISISEILDRWQGESEKRLVAAFTEARNRKPAILFFDEIEALAARRHYDSDSGKASLVSAFLSAFDGLSTNNDGILVLAATNVPWAIDSAFRRPGRFDRVLFVPPPDKESRLAILQGLVKDRPVAPGLDLEKYAAATSGCSGADLMNLVETAIDIAIEQELSGTAAPVISRKHFDAAMSEIQPTTLEWLSTARNYAKYAAEPGMYTDLLSFLDKHKR